MLEDHIAHNTAEIGCAKKPGVTNAHKVRLVSASPTEVDVDVLSQDATKEPVISSFALPMEEGNVAHSMAAQSQRWVDPIYAQLMVAESAVQCLAATSLLSLPQSFASRTEEERNVHTKAVKKWHAVEPSSAPLMVVAYVAS